MAYVIRTHDRTAFKQCRLYWLYKQSYEPRQIPENLEFGTAIHKGLEAYYNPGIQPDHRSNLAIEEFIKECNEQLENHPYCGEPTTIDEYEDRKNLGVGMLDYYCDNYAPYHDDFNVIAVEWDFEAPLWVPPSYYSHVKSNTVYTLFDVNGYGQLVYLNKPVVYQGTIDMIIERDGELFIVDHKTRRAFKDSTFHLDVDTQISSYAWAANQFLPKPATGIIFNELKKSFPEKPKVLKSGALSKDKSQNTTYDLYMEAIRENGFNTEPYNEILEFLNKKDEKYVRRIEVERNQKQLEKQGEYIFQEAIEMLNNPFIYPTPNEMNCPGCPFKYPCLAHQEGEDEGFILENEDLFTPIGASND